MGITHTPLNLSVLKHCQWWVTDDSRVWSTHGSQTYVIISAYDFTSLRATYCHLHLLVCQWLAPLPATTASLDLPLSGGSAGQIEALWILPNLNPQVADFNRVSFKIASGCCSLSHTAWQNGISLCYLVFCWGNYCRIKPHNWIWGLWRLWACPGYRVAWFSSGLRFGSGFYFPPVPAREPYGWGWGLLRHRHMQLVCFFLVPFFHLRTSLKLFLFLFGIKSVSYSDSLLHGLTQRQPPISLLSIRLV